MKKSVSIIITAAIFTMLLPVCTTQLARAEEPPLVILSGQPVTCGREDGQKITVQLTSGIFKLSIGNPNPNPQLWQFYPEIENVKVGSAKLISSDTMELTLAGNSNHDNLPDNFTRQLIYAGMWVIPGFEQYMYPIIEVEVAFEKKPAYIRVDTSPIEFTATEYIRKEFQIIDRKITPAGADFVVNKSADWLNAWIDGDYLRINMDVKGVPQGTYADIIEVTTSFDTVKIPVKLTINPPTTKYFMRAFPMLGVPTIGQEDGFKVVLVIEGRLFLDVLHLQNWTVQGLSGVTVGAVERITDHTATVTLAGNSLPFLYPATQQVTITCAGDEYGDAEPLVSRPLAFTKNIIGTSITGIDDDRLAILPLISAGQYTYTMNMLDRNWGPAHFTFEEDGVFAIMAGGNTEAQYDIDEYDNHVIYKEEDFDVGDYTLFNEKNKEAVNTYYVEEGTMFVSAVKRTTLEMVGFSFNFVPAYVPKLKGIKTSNVILNKPFDPNDPNYNVMINLVASDYSILPEVVHEKYEYITWLGDVQYVYDEYDELICILHVGKNLVCRITDSTSEKYTDYYFNIVNRDEWIALHNQQFLITDIEYSANDVTISYLNFSGRDLENVMVFAASYTEGVSYSELSDDPRTVTIPSVPYGERGVITIPVVSWDKFQVMIWDNKMKPLIQTMKVDYSNSEFAEVEYTPPAPQSTPAPITHNVPEPQEGDYLTKAEAAFMLAEVWRELNK